MSYIIDNILRARARQNWTLPVQGARVIKLKEIPIRFATEKVGGGIDGWHGLGVCRKRRKEFHADVQIHLILQKLRIEVWLWSKFRSIGENNNPEGLLEQLLWKSGRNQGNSYNSYMGNGLGLILRRNNKDIGGYIIYG